MKFRKLVSAVMSAVFFVSSMGITAAATPETVQDKLGAIEKDTYGTIQTGALVDRINKIEKDYDGSHRSGSMMARVNAIYDEVYTNSTKLGVTIVSDAEQSGTVTLVDAATGDGIRYAAVSGRSAVCEFTALTAARRYRVSCEGFSPDAVVTISDARTVSFWHSLRAVLGELLSLLAGG